MDYLRTVEAVIPNVQGKVLGVLARTETELTMRTVSRLAGVSHTRAIPVLNRLVALGMVERREVGSAAVVTLVRDNEAARTILALANLRDVVLRRLRSEARAIKPAPASLVVFGSFATGAALEGSDVDVLAVRAAGVEADDPRWVDSLGRWTDRARRIVGNPINLLVASLDEVRALVPVQGSVWYEAAHHGVPLTSATLLDLRST